VEKIDRAGRSSEVILRRDMSDIIVSLAADADDGFESAGACGGLIFASRSYWKWQWAVFDSESGAYLHGISPRFDTAEEAEHWLRRVVK
tara:strand:- start:1657 stop:1923 length:267 start_codon:yes stop_codon:yes gene_type:complete